MGSSSIDDPSVTAMTEAPGSPTRRGNWFAVGAYALSAATTQLLWLTFAPITTEAAAHYQVSEGAIGFLSIIFPLVYVVLAIPSGLLLDRWFRPALMLGGALAAVGGLVRLVDTDSYSWALAGQIIVAIAQPLVMNAVTKLSVSYLPRPRRPIGIAIGSAGLFAGMVTAFLLGATIGTNIPSLLAVQAGIGVLAAAVLAVALSRPGRFFDQLDLGESETVDAAIKHPLRTVWSDPVVRLLVAVVAVGNGIFVALTTWLQPLLEPAGVSVSSAGVMLLLMVVAGMAGAIVVPALAAKRGNQTSWMIAAIIVTAAGCLALALAPADTSGFIVSLFIGFLLLATLPIVLDMIEKRTGPAASTATALVWMAGNAGGVALSAVVGTAVGAPALGFTMMAVLVAAFGLPITIALRTRIAREGPLKTATATL